MAMLTDKQFRLRIEREKEKQKSIRKKMEIQQKKEIFGENWKAVEQQKIKHDLELEIGSDDAPRIYDSKDLYDFFEPITMYKDKDNKSLKMDYNQFIESEEKFKQSLEEIDNILNSINTDAKQDEDKDKENKEAKDKNSEDEETLNKKEKLKKNKEMFKADGVSAEDNILPADKSDLKEAENSEEREGKEEGEGEEDNEEDNPEEIKKAIKLSPVALAKTKMHQTVSTYLNRYVPLYNKHVCTCCGTPKDLSEYYVSYDITCSDRVDDRGNYHMSICKECANKMLAYYYGVVAKKNIELAMQLLCASLNLYWDVDTFYIAKNNYDKNGRKGTMIGSYVSEVNKTVPGKTFMDSPFLTDEQYSSEHRIVESIDETPYDWSKEDYNNQKEVISIVGYDPFAYEEKDEDKKILYTDLLAIIDEDIQNDYVKLQSAISIVKSFFKVRKLDERQHQLEVEGGTLSDQKAIADLKAKELKTITDFAAANGFSERFKTKQSKGENTFTGVLSRMDKQKFEKSIANRFDVATSSTIQQASDSSFASIFKQLGMNDSEMYKITADQLTELRKLRAENAKLQEEARIAKYNLAQVNLEMKVMLKEKEKSGGDE